MLPIDLPPLEHLHCEVRYASDTWHMDAVPQRDPLAVPWLEMGGRFAFRAVLRGEGGRLRHITLQVQDREADLRPMVHQVQLVAPFAGSLAQPPQAPAAATEADSARPAAFLPSLTGWQHVYSTVLGRELVYGCALRAGPLPASGPALLGTPSQVSPADASRVQLQARPPSGGVPPFWRPQPVPGGASGTEGPTVRLAFVGDVMLADGPGRRVAQGHDPFAAVAERLQQADVRIGNLECVVGTRSRPVDKPWTFLAHPRVLPVLQRHLDAVSLANNHTGDHGSEGFAAMLGHLEAAGLPHFGGGRTLSEAHRALVVERQGLRIALLGYNEFFPRAFEAGADQPGGAWSDDARVVEDIRRARQEQGADLVIPFMHWGSEHEEVSNDRQRALARRLIDAGADAVVGTHPHVVQDSEVYRGKPIVYSLGNFVFDGFSDLANRTGWILFLTVGRDGVRAWHVEPVRQDLHGQPHPVPRPAVLP